MHTTADDRHDEGHVLHVKRAPAYVAALRTSRVVVAHDALTHASSRELGEYYVTTKTAGSGLGLSIVKRLVDGCGGTVAVVSAPSGTTFTVTLPVASAATSQSPTI